MEGREPSVMRTHGDQSVSPRYMPKPDLGGGSCVYRTRCEQATALYDCTTLCHRGRFNALFDPLKLKHDCMIRGDALRFDHIRIFTARHLLDKRADGTRCDRAEVRFDVSVGEDVSRTDLECSSGHIYTGNGIFIL